MDHIWVMVDQDGTQTLFQLVEVGAAPDPSRLIKDLHLPVVMVDVTLPSSKQLEAMRAPRSGSERARFIVVNVRTGNKGEPAGLVAHKNVESEPIAISSSPKKKRSRGTSTSVHRSGYAVR